MAKIDVWVDLNGIVYTLGMLEKKAVRYAQSLDMEEDETLIESVLAKWVKNYDHQVIFVP